MTDVEYADAIKRARTIVEAEMKGSGFEAKYRMMVALFHEICVASREKAVRY